MVGREGSIALIGARSFVAGVEATVRKAMLFGYFGAAHIDQCVALDNTGRAIGYGIPGSTAANRDVQEGTAGVNYTFWREPRLGALQLITQYSYLTRTIWAPQPGNTSDARVHMVFVSARYLLP
jgi:hypothetical protein